MNTVSYLIIVYQFEIFLVINNQREKSKNGGMIISIGVVKTNIYTRKDSEPFYTLIGLYIVLLGFTVVKIIQKSNNNGQDVERVTRRVNGIFSSNTDTLDYTQNITRSSGGNFISVRSVQLQKHIHSQLAVCNLL